MMTIRPAAVTRSKKVRARATNSLTLPNLDGRSAVARRCRDLAQGFARTVTDDAELSVTQGAAVLKAASLITTCEALRAQVLQGKNVDISALVRLEGAADRAVRALKLDRVKPAPTLHDYLASKSTAAAAERAAAPAPLDDTAALPPASGEPPAVATG
jgi:hypothetical protein